MKSFTKIKTKQLTDKELQTIKGGQSVQAILE